MATIVTNANWLQVDGARLQKGKWDLALTAAGVRLSDAGQSVNIPYMDTTIDGDPVESAADLFAFFEAQGFKSGGTGPGTGVQSVTGDGVGGTATNVVLTYPEPGDIGAATAAQGSLADTSIQPDDTSDVAVAGKVALYSNIGAINTVAPQFPENAVNLGYFDAGLATKQDTLSVPSQAESEAGTATTARSWTAQRGKQSVVGASRSVVSVSGSKTLALTDEYTFQNVTAAATITVPANATVALPVGSQIDFFQAGAGVITFAAAGGVTIISKGNTLTTADAGDAATLKKTATNTWALIIAG